MYAQGATVVLGGGALSRYGGLGGEALSCERGTPVEACVQSKQKAGRFCRTSSCGCPCWELEELKGAKAQWNQAPRCVSARVSHLQA